MFATLAAGVATHAAVVYKWVDADGVVHLSDQPVPGAERIVTDSGSGRSGTVTTSAPAATPAPKPKALDFTQFVITSPGKEETFTGNRAVNVSLALDPALTSTQTISWSLNGQPLTNQAPDATQFTLQDLPRGSYTLSAMISDQTSGETKSSESVTFNVMRVSLLAPQRKAPQ